jgi:uncharacterized protein
MRNPMTLLIRRIRSVLPWIIGSAFIVIGNTAMADHTPPGVLVIHFRIPPDYMEKPAGSGPYSQKDIESAMQLAKIGDAEAQSNLGVMYASRGEYEKAAYWYKQAANAGLDTAAYNLGTLYFNGQGFPQDYAKAHPWFEEAASRGNKYAEFQLGMTYFTGQGVEKDPAKETYWYEKAAKQGLPAAQYNLAVNYYNGEGTPQDKVKAYAWMLLAKKGGLGSDSQEALTIMAKSMTPEQIQSAEKLSRSLSSDAWSATGNKNGLTIDWARNPADPIELSMLQTQRYHIAGEGLAIH